MYKLLKNRFVFHYGLRTKSFHDFMIFLFAWLELSNLKHWHL